MRYMNLLDVLKSIGEREAAGVCSIEQRVVVTFYIFAKARSICQTF